MKHIFRVTFENEGLRTQLWGVAKTAERAIALAAEVRGYDPATCTNVVAVGHHDFEEADDGQA